MTICPTCADLIAKLHSSYAIRYGRYYKHKNLIEVLRSAAKCELCNLVVTAPFVGTLPLSDSEPEAIIHRKDFGDLTLLWKRFIAECGIESLCLNIFNRPDFLSVVVQIYEQAPDDFPPLIVTAIQDVNTGISEIAFKVNVGRGHLCGRVSLAVWKDRTCRSDKTERYRHNLVKELPKEWRLDGLMNPWHPYGHEPCANSDIAYRPEGLAFPPGLSAELDLLKSWVKACEDSHNSCKVDLQGNCVVDDVPHLHMFSMGPTRLLHIDGDMLRLMERQDIPYYDVDEVAKVLYSHEPYAALSHCWGPVSHHPPKTTRQNVEQHMSGIALADLPLTFRDAVRIAQHIGLNYLWIDSLCIIQDDEDDWERESPRMDEIYQGARFTIAVADAPHSGVGCFMAKRPDLQRIHPMVNTTETPLGVRPPESGHVIVPSIGRDGLPVTIAFAPVPNESSIPYRSILATQGWALQEWYLSRRIIYCTRGGLSWKCRDIQFNERGQFFDMYQKQDWGHILQRYSETHLSRETDRLIALQGLVKASSANMKGTYHFGTWTHMPQLLLWAMNGPEYDTKGVDAPSWSWASRNGEKIFWTTRMASRLERDRRDYFKPEMSIGSSGVLKTVAPVLQVHAPLAPQEREQRRIFTKKYFHGNSIICPEVDLLKMERPVLYLRLPDTDPKVAIGIAVYDDQDFTQIQPNLSCIMLTKTERLAAIGGAEPSEECVHYQYETKKNTGQLMIWILLVVPVDGVDGGYKRVGMGVISSPACVRGAVQKEISLM